MPENHFTNFRSLLLHSRRSVEHLLNRTTTSDATAEGDSVNMIDGCQPINAGTLYGTRNIRVGDPARLIYR